MVIRNRTWTFRNEDAPNVRDGGVISHCFGRMRQRWPGPGGQHVEVRHRRIGRLAVNVAGGDAVSIVRTRLMAELGAPPILCSSTPQRGLLRVAKRACPATCSPAHIVPFHLVTPSRLQTRPASTVHIKRVPLALTSRNLPSVIKNDVAVVPVLRVGSHLLEPSHRQPEPCGRCQLPISPH